jgi:hypothetical protein
VRACVTLAAAPVLGDTADKSHRAHAAGEAPAPVAVDVLVWQMLASVLIPGATINVTVKVRRPHARRATSAAAAASHYCACDE